jgi:hypothetical protein
MHEGITEWTFTLYDINPIEFRFWGDHACLARYWKRRFIKIGGHFLVRYIAEKGNTHLSTEYDLRSQDFE